MEELIVAFGLVLVIEGLLWAMIPLYALKMMEAMSKLPEASLRGGGVAAVALGVLVIWLARG